jgi:transposase InsO family protein
VDLLRRRFAPRQLALNEAWAGDITYVRTWEGWLYLAAVIDLGSRRVVGWAMADHMRAELVCDALRMAVEARGPAPGLIFHSDRGSQGGFKESMQHLAMEVVRHGCFQASAGDSGNAGPDVVAGAAINCAA